MRRGLAAADLLQRVNWLRDEAATTERDMLRLVAVLAAQRLNRTPSGRRAVVR